MKELVFFLIFWFYLICYVAQKDIVGPRDQFGLILNLLPHLELLMYAKPISLLVGSTNFYGIISYQMYLLPWITASPPFFYLVPFNSGDVFFGCWVTSTCLSGHQKLCCDWINEGLMD